MSAASALIVVHPGRRWVAQVEALGLGAEALESIRVMVADHYIEHRHDFGLAEFPLEPAALGSDLSGILSALLLREVPAPNDVYLLILQRGPIPVKEMDLWKILFRSRLGG